MKCEKIISIVQEQVSLDIKKRKLDDSQAINLCKEIFIEEIENIVDLEKGITKKYIFNMLLDYLDFSKAYFTNQKKYEILKRVSLSTAIFVVLIEYLFNFLSQSLYNLFYIMNFDSFFINIVFLIGILVILFIGQINFCKRKRFKLKNRIDFITLQSLKQLADEEIKNEILEPNMEVLLEEDELKELLSDEYENSKTENNKEILTYTYDRKASLQRRKRRKK